MNRYHRKGVLLASGGIDSTTLMYSLKQQGFLDSVFFVDYGQASAATQERFLEYHVDRIDTEMCTDKIVWPSYARGQGHIFHPESYPETEVEGIYDVLQMDEEAYSKWKKETFDFIEGRNLEFLNRACMYARSRDIDTVYCAFQFDAPEWDARPRGDFENDCSTLFIENFNRLSLLGCYSKPVTVIAPFLESKMSKQTIVYLARALCVPLSATHSCEFFPACGHCRPCRIRKEVTALRPKTP